MSNAYPQQIPTLIGTGTPGGPSAITSPDGTLNAAGEQFAWIFFSLTASAITDVAIHVASVTTPPQCQIEIQGVGTDGLPDGTAKAGTTTNVTPAAGLNKVTLAASYTPTRGEALAIVLRSNAGFGASAVVDVAYLTNINGIRRGHPYVAKHNGTSWSKSTSNTTASIFAYKTSGQWFHWPISGRGVVNSTANHQHGMSFSLPAGWGQTFKISSVEWIGQVPAGGTSIQAFIYDGENGPPTQLDATPAYDTDLQRGAEAGCRYSLVFSNPPALNYGQRYVVAIQCSSAASTLLEYWDVLAQADMDAFWYGQDAYYVTRSSTANSFTPTTTRRPLMWLEFLDITEPGAGSFPRVGSGLVRA